MELPPTPALAKLAKSFKNAVAPAPVAGIVLDPAAQSLGDVAGGSIDSATHKISAKTNRRRRRVLLARPGSVTYRRFCRRRLRLRAYAVSGVLRGPQHLR